LPKVIIVKNSKEIADSVTLKIEYRVMILLSCMQRTLHRTRTLS
jgi:hypothetical protein